jgi:hypothetical protein
MPSCRDSRLGGLSKGFCSPSERALAPAAICDAISRRAALPQDEAEWSSWLATAAAQASIASDAVIGFADEGIDPPGAAARASGSIETSRGSTM